MFYNLKHSYLSVSQELPIMSVSMLWSKGDSGEMFLFITTAVSIAYDLNSVMEVLEMFMHKVIALADLKLPHTMVHVNP